MSIFRSFEKRESLRSSFWSVVDDYLRDLDCPQHYFRPDAGSSPNAANAACWRNNPALRVRMVHWLLSCAISERFSEQTDKNRPSLTTSEDLLPSKLQDFHLGFSSGDSKVDDILKLVRMQYLADLEDEQEEQNQVLANLFQRTTSTSSTTTHNDPRMSTPPRAKKTPPRRKRTPRRPKKSPQQQQPKQG